MERSKVRRHHRLADTDERGRRRRALGGPTGLDAPPPKRPKGMWRRTYERKLDEIWEHDLAASHESETGVIRIIARIEEQRLKREPRRDKRR